MKKNKNKNTNRQPAKIVGVLFLIPIITYMLGDGLINSIIDSPDYLKLVFANKTKMMFGGVLILMNSITVVIIGVVLYPILKQHNEKIALAYFSARLIESILLIVGVIYLLLLVNLSQEYLKADFTDISYFKTISALAIKGHFLNYQMAMAFLGLGSLFFCYSLYKSKLIPRFASLWGFIGYALLLVGAILELFGFELGVLLSIPGGLFEMFLGGWLIFKGFNSSASISISKE